MPGARAVTIRDVAREADVHPGTVSRALNERTRGMVNADTAERVRRVARQLGYRPNSIARGLKTHRSCTIGVLIPDITNPLFPPILRGIEDRLDRAGYTGLIVNTDNDAAREAARLATLRARQVDGYISATARLDRRLLDELTAARLPLVLVNRSLEDGSVPSVTVDEGKGIKLAVEHVTSLEHERVGHIAGPQDTSTGHRRHLGFREAMGAAGLRAADGHVSFADSYTEDEGARACTELLDRSRDLTAIVAANDLLAVGCYDALASRRLRCPEDVSVVGFNDMPFVGRLQPPLTTVRVPQRALGTAAAALLLEQLADDAAPARQVLLEPELIIRGSTARARRRARARPKAG
jgi:LacI family transcriptional regulator